MRSVHKSAIALLLGLSLTACSGSAEAPATGAGAIELVETTPAATGDVDTVTWALPSGEPASLDPARTGDYSANTVGTNLCESLLRLEPDFSTAPGLASAVTQKDPTTVVITLRDGVTFWDGSPLTAGDVVYSLKRNMDPKLASYAAHVYASVTTIEETGPLEVTVTFKTPDVQFIPDLAGVPGSIIQEKFATKAGQAFGTASGGLMCTGPFQLGTWTSGQKISLKRYDAYWDTARKAKAATFDFVFLTDSSTLTSALLSGEVDGVYGAPVGSIAALQRSASGKLYFGPSTETVSLGAVAAEGPAADPKIRQALDLAIDKTSFVTSVLKGAGEPLKTFTPPLAWQGSPAKDVYDAGYAALPDTSKADLEAAKKLVADAAPSRTDLVIATPAGDQSLLQTATIAQAAAGQIGLNVTIKQLQPAEFAGLFYDPALRTGIDLIATTGYLEVPGALYYAPGFVFSGAPFNWTNYENPEVTANIGAAVAETDPVVSAQKFVAAQAIYGPAKLQITLAGSYNRLYLNKRITGAPASFNYISTAWAALVGAA
ncbi:peptide/nickel transport system substrate-binding protein [Actinoplanes lutulentus]|uniref:Peptide/nickel transport system substrate-binding protein n=1 Tax=Actinoplanes lutulentus TaxID=1287878 RepID=A0A327ZHT0_9ACTN|nr:ABC transporter substrate-binding protein [Actinoplanes lutulentus]MBB2944335.1 peptide/nickel transport system substrate-binding protein [Actinoplanes lutulentus]RAK42432.1 peptide/nickel transport system substrate-binding protein [Actinoplanes lutulentus]